MRAEYIKPLQWSIRYKPNSDIRYDHVIANTAFGRFLITWKSWKELNEAAIEETPWGGYMSETGAVEELKQIAEQEWQKRILSCIKTYESNY
jgi:hypothetical protein